MRVASVADVKARLSKYLEECVEGPIIVTKNGRPVAALVVVEDSDDLDGLILAHTPKFRRLIEAAARRIDETGGVRHEDFWKAVEAPG